MTKPAKSLLNITMLSTMSRLVFFVFVFLASYVTSRQLSKSDFGEVQYLMLWVNIGWILFNFGIPNILSRYFTQAVVHKSYGVMKQLIRLACVSAAATIVISGMVLLGLNTQSEMGISSWVLILLVISSVSLFYLQILVQGLFSYKAIFITNILAVATALLFLYYMLPQLGALAFIYTYIIVNGVLSIGYLGICINGVTQLKKAGEQSPFRLPDRRSLVKTAAYFGGSAILAGLLWQRYELSLLKYSVPFSELATYVIAFSVMALVIEPLKLIPGALIYYFASISGDSAKSSEKFSVFFRHFCWLVFFVGTFVFFHAEAIVSFIYTTKYAESAVLLQILLIGMIPGTCSYVMMNMHVGLGKSRFLVSQDIVCVIVFSVLLFLGNHFWGLMGAAWAKSVSIMLSVSLGLWYTGSKLKFHIPYRSLLGALVFSIVLVWSSKNVMSDSILLLAAKAFLLFAVYIIVSLAFHLIDRKLVRNGITQTGKYLTNLFR